jgi:hypothetical protein
MVKRRTALELSLALIALLATHRLPARDVFLTIGGGGSPSGNQVSLEKNVLYFQRVLQELGLADARHDILFSDGNDPGRDLQYVDPTFAVPEANRLLAQLCNQEEGLADQYRTHQVPGIRGPSTRDQIEHWFDAARDELKAGDRLLIYFTGHGGKGSDVQSNHMVLWNGDKLTVQELAGQLDKLDPRVQVTLVMVQCYSGGFANLIFHEANAEKGATPARRCGFFATTHDRVAAGCTSDIDEENYQEYSSYFWAALAGHKRLGETISRPDYDGDGRTSFGEAHAFALLESDTIDVSRSTSDALLAATSKTEGQADLLSPDAPQRQLLQAASPIDRAVLSGLAERLQLGEEGAAGARELLQRTKQEKAEVDKQKGRAVGQFKKIGGEILKSLKLRWPELGNPWHPRLPEILSLDNAAVLEAIHTHARYSELARLHDEIESLKDRALDLERRAAKCQRFLNVAQRIALAANLPKVAPAEAVARYDQLLAAERATLGQADLQTEAANAADAAAK